ncbi:MAG: DUF883 domain-containing protein [Oxalobacter sp.]|nr:MAG: DUF883 domain-containing protein [Oxalobacter sp.]
MFESNIRAINKDVKVLITDAQALFQAAASLTGDKAEEMRKRGMQMLDNALLGAHNAQAHAIDAGKRVVSSTDHYIKENPWHAVAVATGLGLLIGVILSKK